MKISSSSPQDNAHIITNEGTQLVVDSKTQSVIGGIGANHFRPWVFPFYSPSGRTVIQAYPHAHPWHNGIFVGQQSVLNGNRTANLWAVPPIRRHGDPIFENVGRMQIQDGMKTRTAANGVEFQWDALWLDKNEIPVLTESRTVRLFADQDAHFCDVSSTRRATHGSLIFPIIKLGGMGVRVEPRLSPDAGGMVVADGGRRGNASVAHETDSDFVAYEAGLPDRQGGVLGVCLMIQDTGVRGPWFVRDFGLVLYHPAYEKIIEVPENGAWTTSLRVIAYDGKVTEERAAQWKKAEFDI